ncbi:MAG: hypothetical protein Q8L48_28800 [Archangium sp.]|nr:hypothetical protein [Archangium sp.]
MTQLSTRLGLCAATLTFLLAGCEGTAGEPDGGTGGFDAGPFDAGPQPIKYEQYLKRTDGWPAGARVRGAAVLDNVLYVASDQGLLSLDATQTRWATVTTPLTGDVKPTSLDRIDQSLVMTAAGAAGGGLYVKVLDGAWTQVTTAPSTPSWTLVKKSTDFLLATTGGLFASQTLSGPYVRRSVVNTAVFAAPLTQLVAAPAQQKLFAWGVSGGLFESIDSGRNWTASTLRGPVEALAAMGAFVVVSTGMDGQQRSDNYGNTFRPAANPIAGGVLLYVSDGTKFWAGGNGGLKSSADDGVTFTDDSDGLPTGTAVRALFFAGSYAIVDTPEGPFINQP